MFLAFAACRQVLGVDGTDIHEDRTTTGPGGAGGQGGSASSSSSSQASSGGGGMGCGDTQASDVNCGVCGHACAVGHCAMGTCQPEQVVQQQLLGEYQSLIVDPEPDGYVFWARYRRPGQIFRAKKSPGAKIELLTTLPSDGYVFDHQADQKNLYFSNFSSEGDHNPVRGFYSMGKDGKGLKLFAGGGSFGACNIYPFIGLLFLSTCYDTLGLGSIPVSGGSIHPILTYLGNPPFFEQGRSFFTDGQWIYYSELSTGINRLFLLGGAPDVIHPGEVGSILGAPAGKLIYVVQEGSVRRASLDGIGPVDHIAQIKYLRGWFFRGNLLYFSDGPAIRRVDVAALEPKVEDVYLAKDTVGSLAADATSFYWLDFATSAIFRKSF